VGNEIDVKNGGKRQLSGRWEVRWEGAVEWVGK